MANSRLKDYLDLQVLLQREALDLDLLARAIAATFTRRGTAVPREVPLGLSEDFAGDVSRQTLWRAFLRKNELPMSPLSETVEMLREQLQPALMRAAEAFGKSG